MSAETRWTSKPGWLRQSSQPGRDSRSSRDWQIEFPASRRVCNRLGQSRMPYTKRARAGSSSKFSSSASRCDAFARGPKLTCDLFGQRRYAKKCHVDLTYFFGQDSGVMNYGAAEGRNITSTYAEDFANVPFWSWQVVHRRTSSRKGDVKFWTSWNPMGK